MWINLRYWDDKHIISNCITFPPIGEVSERVLKIGLESGIASEMDKRNNLPRRLWLDVIQSICMLMCDIQVNRYLWMYSC